MFGQFALLPEPFGADGVVVDGVVVAAEGVVVVAAAVPEDDPPADDPEAALAIATTPPANAPVATTLASIMRTLIVYASFARPALLVDPIARDSPESRM